MRAFVNDVVRRVFRFDKTFALTFWRMIRAPGELARDYFAGRRHGYLDPIQYFISCVFIQIVVAASTHLFAPMIDRLSALNWVGRLSGVVAVKILVIFWMGTLWRVLFRTVRYNLAEIYVFATYALGTTGLLWAFLPLVDLIVPLPLGANAALVTLITLAVEAAYLTYAVRSFSQLPLWICLFRVTTVMIVGYVLLAGLLGIEHAVRLVLPPMPIQQ